ncbi:hypothetical protein B0T16DRAFT_453800 [Cercophora newfieldiana]|uniref:Uncharacterized protein n=1 Tax=Cercophora newfieldiana TaxID=92897 RepID=A0AA40CTY7_9PEZI|nr:hypothetical protein B0T16DRAFT_453800 [Cercophora newfieldiana]
MVANHGGAEVQSERERAPSPDEDDDRHDRGAESEVAKPRVVMMDGMSLSFEFEEGRFGLRLDETEEDSADYVTEQDDDDEYPIILQTSPQAVARHETPEAEGRKDNDDENDKNHSPEKKGEDDEDDSTDSDEEGAETGCSQLQGTYYERLTKEDHKVFMERLKQAGKDILWILPAADFKIMTGYDRSRHTWFWHNGAKRIKTVKKFRADLCKLWQFKMFPAFKIHRHNQSHGKKRPTCAERLARCRNGPPASQPSPLRQSWEPKDLDDSPE